ncbi:tetratricopeptide repeat protein [Labrenzia sp. VG12]|uniref:tetratricopeptide repeat protein n=1 Tax=Labrenzia sp. VG12 TaxID=2021862 RepID=UPI000B8C25C6|nr:tetratricopeptide repeat protein [Labrenzia sp. VG12]ASP35425.1 hypothetical protein CHH27_21090 [Labrenzia sp. VG12]
MSNLNALLDAANQHLENGSIEDAEELCRQALSRAPSSIRALKTYGRCQIATGDLEAAIKSFEFVLQMDPQDASASYNLALAHNAQGNLDLACVNFERALSLDPENPTFHEAMATVHAFKGEIEDSLRHLLIAQELKPDDPNVMSNLGSVLAQIGAYYDARRYFEQVLALQPENGPVAIQLAHILQEQGDTGRALELTEALYLKRPREPMVLSAFARSLALVGELDRAADLLDLALKIAPDMVNALEEYALVSAYRGDPDRGLAKLAALLKTQKDNPHLCLLLATAMSRAGKHAESVTLAQPALKDITTGANGLALVRQGLFHQGKFAEARELAAQVGLGTAGLNGGLAGALEKVIIPLETKPLEAILFARFLSGAGETGDAAERIVYAHEPLVPLLQRMDLGFRLEPLEGKSLFEIAETGNACFMASFSARPEVADYDPAGFRPYLKTDPRADDFWRGSLAPLKGPLVGVTWGKHAPAPLLHHVQAGLADWPGAVLSLMWDDQRAELEGNRKIIDAGAHLKSLEMLVDLVGKLDLVVGPDGLVTHIAGALGIPTIVLATPDKQWYWYAPEGRSHWYPSVQVLERPWAEPMEHFTQRLSNKLAEMTGVQAA